MSVAIYMIVFLQVQLVLQPHTTHPIQGLIRWLMLIVLEMKITLLAVLIMATLAILARLAEMLMYFAVGLTILMSRRAFLFLQLLGLVQAAVSQAVFVLLEDPTNMKEELKFVSIKLGVVYVLLVGGIDKQLKLSVYNLETILVWSIAHINIIIYYYVTVNVDYGTVNGLQFPSSSGPVFVGYFSCSGNVANLLECSPNYYNTYYNCRYRRSYDAAVICESKCNIASCMGIIFWY